MARRLAILEKEPLTYEDGGRQGEEVVAVEDTYNSRTVPDDIAPVARLDVNRLLAELGFKSVRVWQAVGLQQAVDAEGLSSEGYARWVFERTRERKRDTRLGV